MRLAKAARHGHHAASAARDCVLIGNPARRATFKAAPYATAAGHVRGIIAAN